MDRSEQRCSKYASHSHHVERIECPVVEALEEEDETEDPSNPEARREEPPALPKWIHQEYRHED